jgi:hypothetical protein
MPDPGRDLYRVWDLRAELPIRCHHLGGTRRIGFLDLAAGTKCQEAKVPLVSQFMTAQAQRCQNICSPEKPGQSDSADPKSLLLEHSPAAQMRTAVRFELRNSIYWD